MTGLLLLFPELQIRRRCSCGDAVPEMTMTGMLRLVRETKMLLLMLPEIIITELLLKLLPEMAITRMLLLLPCIQNTKLQLWLFSGNHNTCRVTMITERPRQLCGCAKKPGLEGHAVKLKTQNLNAVKIEKLIHQLHSFVLFDGAR